MKLHRIRFAFPWRIALILAFLPCLPLLGFWAWFQWELPPLQRYYLAVYWQRSETANQPHAQTQIRWLMETAPGRKRHWLFVDARAQVTEETLGNLSSFYAMFPGNHKFNVFPLWLAEDHHARLSSVFAPHIGHPHSEDLDSEYLNIFETRTRTPFFQDMYVDAFESCSSSAQQEPEIRDNAMQHSA